MQDVLLRGTLGDLDVRFSYCVCTAVANEAVVRHDCDPLSAHVLSRALGAAILTAPLLNGDEKASFRWNYGGAVRTVLVDVDSRAEVRGFIAPTDLLNDVDEEAKLYGETGKLTVIRSDCRRTLSSGTVDLALMDVIDDLCYFFAASDQIETCMCVMVGFTRDPKAPVSLCQGIMLQALPGSDLEAFETVRQRLNAESCRELLGQSPVNTRDHVQSIFRHLTAGSDVESRHINVAPVPVFRCSCTPERMLSVVSTLGVEDLEEIIGKQEGVGVSCQFCAEEHHIDTASLQRVLEEKRAPEA